MKTIVHFKCNIEMDLVFYVRVRTCEKRVTGNRLYSYTVRACLIVTVHGSISRTDQIARIHFVLQDDEVLTP